MSLSARLLDRHTHAQYVNHSETMSYAEAIQSVLDA